MYSDVGFQDLIPVKDGKNIDICRPNTSTDGTKSVIDESVSLLVWEN